MDKKEVTVTRTPARNTVPSFFNFNKYAELFYKIFDWMKISGIF